MNSKAHLSAILSLLAVVLLSPPAAVPAEAAGTPFRQVQRINGLTMQFGTDTFATANAYGGAFVGSAARSSMQGSINTAIGSGTNSLLLDMRTLTDLTGTNQPSFAMGAVNGPPAPGASYSGASDLDWWYVPNANEIDVNGVPIRQLSAAIAANALKSDR